MKQKSSGSVFKNQTEGDCKTWKTLSLVSVKHKNGFKAETLSANAAAADDDEDDDVTAVLFSHRQNQKKQTCEKSVKTFIYLFIYQ